MNLHILPENLFTLEEGTIFSKKELSDSIRNKNGYFNSYQRGINWFGHLSDYKLIKGCVLRSFLDTYTFDGWIESDSKFKYCLQRLNGIVDHSIAANQKLIQQKRFGYPIFLFTEITGEKFLYHGKFEVDVVVTESANPHVILIKN